MASRTILEDDIDGTVSSDETPVFTWQFGLGARNNFKTYSIDLTSENYRDLEEALAPYVKVATEDESRPSSASKGRLPSRPGLPRGKANDKGYTASDVRAWAAKEGIDVAPRGRIHKDVIDKYEYAMEKDKK